MSTVATTFTGGSLEAAVTGLGLTLATYENVELVACLLDQNYDVAGNLVEVVDVSFAINGRPGVFTVYPSFAPSWDAVAVELVTEKWQIVEGIYQGLADMAAAGLPVASGVPPSILSGHGL